MGIYAKIADVMSKVHAVPKTGRNEFHKYDYATEADVVNAIRPLLMEAGLVLVLSGQTMGRDGDITSVKLNWTLTDKDSGEAIEGYWFGQGQDKGDKGIYKAITGAQKYLLLKMFMVPTGDDPEQDAPPKAKKPPKKAPEEPSQTIRQLRQKVLLKEATLAGLASTHAEMHALEEGFEHLYPEKMREQTKKLAAESTDAERLQKCIHWLEEQIDKAKLTEVVA